MRFQVACAGAVALALAGGVAHAHHSFAMFDMTKEVTVTGTVRQFQWTNPHAYIELDVPDGTTTARVEDMCRYLLANTVIEDFRVEGVGK